MGGVGVPPQIEISLQSETGSGGGESQARVGKQNGETEGDRDVERMTDSGSSRERENRGEEKYELPTPYLLFSIKQIFFFLSNGSCRSRLGGTSIPITMLPTHGAR